MKKTLTIAAIALLGLASCKKCETCTTTVDTDAPGTTNDYTTVTTSEVCGTDEIKAAEGTITSTATQSGVTVTITQTTTCL